MDKNPKIIPMKNIYNKYREILEKTDLTDREIEAMRYFIREIAKIICEHVWKKKFY